MKKKIVLHHVTLLAGQNVELMGHSPYIPDLAHNDFFLFPHIKRKVRGQRFFAPENAVEALQNKALEMS